MSTQKLIFAILLILATRVGVSQGIQPLGLLKGNYNIATGSASTLTTFCFDKTLVTHAGSQYNRLAKGTATVTVGNKTYPLEDAIDKGLIEISYYGSDASGMKLSVKNKSGQAVRIDVNDLAILSDKSTTEQVKSTVGFYENIAGLGVTRQDYIWFSQEYKAYLAEFQEDLVSIGLLKSGESIPVNEYLSRRKALLQREGMSDFTLIDQDGSEQEFTLEWDRAIVTLIGVKQEIALLRATGVDFRHIRYASVDGAAYYVVDKGSGPSQLVKNANDFISTEKTVVAFDNGFPPQKEKLLTDRLRNRNYVVLSDVSKYDISGLSPILSEDAKITAVQNVEEQIIEIDFNALGSDEELFVASDHKGTLAKVGDYFRNLIGIPVNKSVAQIYIESRAVARQSFPGVVAKTKVALNFQLITLSRAEVKENIEKLFPGTHVTFRSKN